MSLYRDRVKDTTTTTGTGSIALSGTAPTGFVAFASAFQIGDRFRYAISSSGGAEWEVGEGYLVDATTLVRDTVEASSNGGAAVSFSSGTKDVFNTISGADASVFSSSAYMLIARGNFFQ